MVHKNYIIPAVLSAAILLVAAVTAWWGESKEQVARAEEKPAWIDRWMQERRMMIDSNTARISAIEAILMTCGEDND